MDKVILEGIVGSQAYGLANENSDIDKLGIFVAPTEEILGIHKVKETIDHSNPDYCYHEVGKYIRLAMKCNPTILELMWLDGYLQATPEGRLLRNIRKEFLSTTVFNSYGGYALAQAKRLNKRSMGRRYTKHARHCFRLLLQGKELLETGNMNIRLKNPEEILAIGELEPDKLMDKFEEEFKKTTN